jgi:hypothetical protein
LIGDLSLESNSAIKGDFFNDLFVTLLIDPGDNEQYGFIMSFKVVSFDINRGGLIQLVDTSKIHLLPSKKDIHPRAPHSIIVAVQHRDAVAPKFVVFLGHIGLPCLIVLMGVCAIKTVNV